MRPKSPNASATRILWSKRSSRNSAKHDSSRVSTQRTQTTRRIAIQDLCALCVLCVKSLVSGAPMIARLWHGWTKPENANEYEGLLRTWILPEIHRIQGYNGAWLMRRRAGEEVEFITLTFW